MNAPDWNTVKSFDDFATTLEQLLQEARAASLANDSARKEEVITWLIQFQKKSPDDTCGSLDEIAQQAVRDIVKASIAEALDGIAERSSALAQYLKEMKAIVADTKKAAESLRLVRAKELVLASSRVVEAAMNLRAELKKNDNEDKKLSTQIEAAVQAMQELNQFVAAAQHK